MANDHHRELFRQPPPQALLPVELVDTLNRTYLLHMLASEPSKVVPSGKSLFSLVMNSPELLGQHKEPEIDVTQSSLRSKVESVVYQAFWDDALSALSDPNLAIQLERLKALHHDLFEAISPLFPPGHPVIVSISSPIPPTTAPLQSSIRILRELVIALRERCAPVRDQELDSILTRIDDPPPPSGFPRALVDLFKDVMHIAAQMQEDFSSFVLSRMSEQDLQMLVTDEALSKENILIHDLWRPEHGPTSSAPLKERWSTWLQSLDLSLLGLADQEVNPKWIARLMQSLIVPSTVACDLPPQYIPDGTAIDPHRNTVPPHFLFLCPELLFIQNLLQAIVVAAALRSLTRFPSRTNVIDEQLLQRVMTLLRLEIDESSFGTINNEPSTERTHIVHLADELTRTLNSTGTPLSPEQESKLREAVDRTLKTTDPVFVLLQKRLVYALTLVLLSWFQTHLVDGGPTGFQPMHLRTGRDVRNIQSSKASAFGSRTLSTDDIKIPVVKGFEGTVLHTQIMEAVKRLTKAILWLHVSWQVE